MKILMASQYGFCMGVTRAVDLLQKVVLENPDKKIVTIGAFIHNSDFLKEIQKLGVEVVGVDAQLKPGTIALVRTHGLPPDKINFFKKQGIELIDATCPKVRASQHWISKFTIDRPLVVVGDKHHAEVISLCGFAKESYVINSLKEAARLKLNKAFVVAQTTISQLEYDSICNQLEFNISDLMIKQTVCNATQDRQSALRALIPSVEAVIVVGGKASSNTKQLFQIAKEEGIPAFHIENCFDITEKMKQILLDCTCVGVTAGASTPQKIVQNVCDLLSAL